MIAERLQWAKAKRLGKGTFRMPPRESGSETGPPLHRISRTPISDEFPKGWSLNKPRMKGEEFMKYQYSHRSMKGATGAYQCPR